MWLTALLFVSSMLLSSLIYVVFLLTIIRFRKQEPFSSSYFFLSVPLGIADLCSLFNSYLTVKLSTWGFFPASKLRGWPWMAAVGFHMSSVLVLFQNFAVLLLALNRLTATIRPLHYNGFWRKWAVPSIVFEVVMSVLIHGSLSFYSSPQFLHYGCENGTDICFMTFGDENAQKIKTQFTIGGLCLMLLTLLCGLCYVVNIAVLLKNKHQGGNSLGSFELKLFACGFCTFVSMATCFGVTLALRNKDRVRFAVWWFLVSDLFAYINPYLLLCCSKDVRTHFKQTLSCRKNTPVIPMAPKTQAEAKL